MKKLLLFIAIAAIFAATTAASNDAQNSFATVNQEQGLFIFTDCRPNTQYQILGTLKAKKVNMDLETLKSYSLSYEQLKDDIFRQIGKKKNRGKYERADAVIFYPDRQKADIIAFIN